MSGLHIFTSNESKQMPRMMQQPVQNRDPQTNSELLSLLHISTALTSLVPSDNSREARQKEMTSVRRQRLQGGEIFNLWLRVVRAMRAQHVPGSGLNTASCLTLPNFQK